MQIFIITLFLFLGASSQTSADELEGEERSNAGVTVCMDRPGFNCKHAYCPWSIYAENCKQSCGFCGETTSPCKDEFDERGCKTLVDNGDCNVTAQRLFCKKSCKACGQATPTCYDDLFYEGGCQRLKDGGFCENDAFTNKYCRQTCEKCGSPKVPEGVVTPPCGNIFSSANCPQKMDDSDCNKAFWRWYCQQTCTGCVRPSTTTTSPTTMSPPCEDVDSETCEIHTKSYTCLENDELRELCCSTCRNAEVDPTCVDRHSDCYEMDRVGACKPENQCCERCKLLTQCYGDKSLDCRTRVNDFINQIPRPSLCSQKLLYDCCESCTAFGLSN